MRPKLRVPQIVVTESDRSSVDFGVWTARLLNPRLKLLDVASNFGYRGDPRPAGKWEARITQTGVSSYCLVTHGGSKGSRRYRTFASYLEAQDALLKWFRGRFRVAPEV